MNHDNHKLSISSNYAGDVRALYMGFYDTFLLKSLNAIDHLPDGTSIVYHKKTNQYWFIITNIEPIVYDHVIFATGWEFNPSMFTFEVAKKGHLPDITPEYESTSHQGLYFIGSLSHALEKGKSSGGFIHGFRYVIRYFYQLHYLESFPIRYVDIMKDTNSLDQLVNNQLDLTEFSQQLFIHLNQTSAMYQMYGLIATIFYREGDRMKMVMDVSHYLYTYTVRHNHPIQDMNEYVFCITLEYGKEKNLLMNRVGLKESTTGTEHLSKLLHPVIRVYRHHEFIKEYHFDEDLLAKFIHPIVYHKRLIDIITPYLS